MDRMLYPALVIDHDCLRENTRKLCEACADSGVMVAGIIKGAGGMVSVARTMVEGGAALIGSSRLEQLERCREAGIEVPLLMIRLPMLSEVPAMVRTADISLNSEMVVLEALNEEALRQGKRHEVILMADLGDLREGYFDPQELMDAAVRVEREMDGLVLGGIGTNLGCYGSVMPTEDKMLALAELAEAVEARIGRTLTYVSGGATSSLLAVFGGYMPPKVNMLRLGCGPLVGPLEDVRTCYDCREMDALGTPFTLQAEVIECKKKASHPIGQLGVDAFGKKQTYVDRGMRTRALLAVGRADYGDISDLFPVREGIEVIGASGDHTILDVEAIKDEIAVGDIIEMKLKYSAILNLSSSENVYVMERSTADND